MFRALLAHLQETLHKQRLVYCVRVKSILVQPTDIIRTHYTSVVCAASSEDEQVVLETCRSHYFIITE
jgi:hypothetical protein